MIPRDFKGKARANVQTEGSGGADGIVLPLQVVGNGVYDIAYTIEASVGAGGQKLYLQVDTGSSDLWIASKSCSTSPCDKTSGHLYDPSSSTPTGENFKIDYLQGSVSGPVVWDKFDLGGYSLDSQALAAADSVTSEPLSPTFSGILGLALPLNSIIASQIPPVTSNTPDGAAWASNLFSITPSPSAPSARFLSLLLSRPGSPAVPAQLAIGRHPSFVSDPSKVQYASLESESQGTLFWKVGVRAINVWVGGEMKPVQIGRAANGAVFPSAVLDSGVPRIFTTSSVANGIYGAIGVSPGADGQYYVPCTTPLNLTITLDDRHPIPLHPLDLTAKSSNDDTSCIGLIQSADTVLTLSNSPGDIILGVPFLRNTYTVMAYEPPDSSGVFDTTNSSPAGDIKPSLGLIGITDPTRALDEFNTVRVLNQPLSSSSSSGSGSSSNPGSGSGSGSSSSSNDGGGVTVGQHLSVGIIVLVSLLGFFALCLALFGVRWWVTRRRFRRGNGGEFSSSASASASASALGSGVVLAGLSRTEKEGGYAYALASTRGSRDTGTGTGTGTGKGKIQPGKELYADEETMRSERWEPYMQDHGLVDLGLAEKGAKGQSEREAHPEHHDREGDGEGEGDGEMGVRVDRDRRRRDEEEEEEDEVWGDGDDTLVVGRGGIVRPHERTLSTGMPLLHEVNLQRGRSRSRSISGSARSGASGMGTGSSERSRSRGGVDEFGVLPPEHEHDAEEGARERTSMAGVGTAARGGKIGVGVGVGVGVGRWRDSSGSGSGSGSGEQAFVFVAGERRHGRHGSVNSSLTASMGERVSAGGGR